MPSLPAGKPLAANHSKYETGRSQSNVPLYFPKGMLWRTSSSRIFGFGCVFDTVMGGKVDNRELCAKLVVSNLRPKVFAGLNPNSPNPNGNILNFRGRAMLNLCCNFEVKTNT